jgi:hypothetical protein
MICSYFFFVYRNIDDECSDELRLIEGINNSWPPLLNHISTGFFSKLEFSLGFLYLSLISQDTPSYCDFSRFFLYIIRRKDQQSCDVRGEGRGTRDIIQYFKMVPPPPPPQASLHPSLDPKVGGGGGGNTQFRRGGWGIPKSHEKAVEVAELIYNKKNKDPTL